MALQGIKKRDYQREYMREYQRRKRGSKQGLSTGSKQRVTPFEELKQRYDIRQGSYKPGDRVLVKPLYGRSKKLVEVTIPQLDADGNPIPEY